MGLRISINKRLPYAILLLLAMLCRGSAFSICSDYFIGYSTFLLVISLIFFIANNRFIPIDYLKHNYIPLLIIFLSLPSMIYNWSEIGRSDWLVYFSSIMIAYFLSMSCDKEDALYAYSKVIVFISLLSLLFYLIFNIFNAPIGWMQLLIKTTDSSVQYRSIYFYNILLSDTQRNCGPFWEPSIFAAYIGFALIIQLFLLEQNLHKTRNSIILILCMLTTFSTGGYIILLVIFIMYLWRTKNNGFHIFSVSITIIALIVVLFFWNYFASLLLNLNYDVFSKLVFFNDVKSSSTRWYSLLSDLIIFKDNPLFGVGLTKINDLFYFTSNSVAGIDFGVAQTSTTFMLLATLGIFGIYPSIAFIKTIFEQNKINTPQKILFLIIVFFVLNETPHINFTFTYLFLFMLCHRDKELLYYIS